MWCTDLSGAQLKHVNLSGVDFRGADFRDTDLRGVRGLTCGILKHATDWRLSIRDEDLECKDVNMWRPEPDCPIRNSE